MSWRILVPEAISAMAPYEIPHIPGIRVKLDANENPWPLPEPIAAELGAELARVLLNRYPDGRAPALRDVIATQAGCRPTQLVLGNGSDELIGMLVSTFARPRVGTAVSGVAYPTPSFVVYRMATVVQGHVPIEIPLREDFTLDGGRLADVLATTRPNILFLALPNNPTGTLWDRAIVEHILVEHPDMILVADEAYLDYSGVTHLDLQARHPNLVVMRTLSKLGLAGLRVGYVIADEEVVRELEKTRPPYNVGSLNQVAAAHLLMHHRPLLDEGCRKVVAERERLFGELSRMAPLRVFPSRANLLLFRVGEPGDGRATQTWRRLAERGVLVRSFDRPGPLAGCLRVTVGTPADNDRFLEALRS